MDTLSALLDGPRANGAFMLRSVMTAPWGLHVRDEAPLSIAVVVTGEAWVVSDDAEPAHLGPGDVMIARGPESYTVADAPTTPPGIFIEPGQHCVDAEGNSLEDVMTLGTRTWGNDVAGETLLVTGTYESTRAVSDRLLRSLPAILVLRAAEWDGRLVDVLCDEMTRDELGQEVYLDRLLDLVLIEAVRAWFAGDPARTPAWHRAAREPIVGPALQLLEADVARPWTLDALAREIGVSRAALARRFTASVGQPPMAYLTDLRLDHAADLLRDPTMTIAAVARRVGYGSSFALSAAFKRVRGVSPSQHRVHAS
ncbi:MULTISPECIES: AraC family transcriptional regulator [Aeromicrobium]|uniref:Helix-turn-helix domain-containing protein n=1 Tax=Aeromicrobium yanjiei TaxID=2662028 RepID=A0A5Q2MI60_9ACTN|nr:MULTISPECIES: AraC family transcriptional regulator [Aeromicrobium]MRK01786.1 helix-turn-helix domain-containing protein [Aeromicrobium sp. S22]QGG41469.1 helix-turn-helix domain-containing protein [Aeromicrobium yanjiei]